MKNKNNPKKKKVITPKKVDNSIKNQIFKLVYSVFLLTQFGEGVQKSGRAGGVVIQKNGRQRQFRAPALVQSNATGIARGRFGSWNTAFTNLSQALQKAWNDASFTTVDRLSRVQQLSGKSAFTRLNVNLEYTAQADIDTPPVSMLPASPIATAVLTADDSAHTISLAYTPNVDAGIVMVFATAPQRPSIFKPSKGLFKFIGTFDGTAASPYNATLKYDAVFGVNAVAGVGKKIFLRLQTVSATGNASSNVGVVTIIVA